MSQLGGNCTPVTQFEIVGIPDIQPEYYQLLAWFFFLVYVTTVTGDLILVLLFALAPRLQKPMYVIIVSLALSDAGFTTVALPKIIVRYWWDQGSFSFVSCLMQQHMIHTFEAYSKNILAIMAVDRLLAICFPFRYSALMTNLIMSGVALLNLLFALSIQVANTIRFYGLPFCGSNQILHIYCDGLSMYNLASINRHVKVPFTRIIINVYLPYAFIIFSYIFIIIVVMRMPSKQGRAKTFSTCSTQGCIICIYYIPRCAIYILPSLPNSIMTPEKRIVTLIIAGFLPPLVNPFVFCLRTQEIKDMFRRWLQRRKNVVLRKPVLVSTLFR